MFSPGARHPDVHIQRLIILFGIVYFAQGLGQDDGLLAQPLRFYFKDVLGMGPAQSTEFLAVLTVPWTIKPLYGLVSDFVPLLGYRRKSWLMLANLLAASGLLWLTGVSQPMPILVALMMTAVGTAAADVIIDAVMVESGKQTGLTAQFQSAQWFWISFASIVSALLGGALCAQLRPGTALHVAAFIAVFAPLVAMMACWIILREDRASVDLAQMRATTSSLLTSFKSKSLWAVMAFLAFWNFSPSFGTPWYYHQVDTLKFSQGFVGVLAAFQSFGGMLGAVAYWRYFSRRSLRQQLVFGIYAGTLGTLLLLFLLSPSSYSAMIAIHINIVVGAATMIAMLATLTLAAQSCQSKIEGFTFAALMSVTNGAAQVSAIIGARLYSDVFHSMLPLILISAAFTAACLLLLPILETTRLEVARPVDDEPSQSRV